MAKEHDELLDHEYDGIREYDNPLPRWWLWLFYGSIVFAVIYTPYYYLGFGPTSTEEYEQEMEAAKASRAAMTAPAAAPAAGAPGAPSAPPAAEAPSLQGNAAAIAEGKTIYATNCMPCHGMAGEGGIGPNLTDAYWIHGNTYDNIVHTVTVGVPDKGMIAWQAMLNPEKIRQVSAFVFSLKGSNPPNAKPPQGEHYPE